MAEQVYTEKQILELVTKYHCLADPAVEIPAIIDAFLFAMGSTSTPRFLEVGTWQGATCSAIALAVPDAEIWTLDLPEPHRAKWNPQPRTLTGIAYRELGLEGRVKQLWMDSGELAGLRGKEAFDLVFVDADHSTDGCLRDLRNAAGLLRPDGVIVVHDYTDESDAKRPHWTQWVHEAVRQFCAEAGFEAERLPGWLAALHQPGSTRRVADPELQEEEQKGALFDPPVKHDGPILVVTEGFDVKQPVPGVCPHGDESRSDGLLGTYCENCNCVVVQDEDGRWIHGGG